MGDTHHPASPSSAPFHVHCIQFPPKKWRMVQIRKCHLLISLLWQPPNSPSGPHGPSAHPLPPGGSVDTTKTRSGPQRVSMSSGERPMGAAKGSQSDTEALCQPPPPPRTHTHTHIQKQPTEEPVYYHASAYNYRVLGATTPPHTHTTTYRSTHTHTHTQGGGVPPPPE